MVLGRAASEQSDVIGINKSWKYNLEETSKSPKIPFGAGPEPALDQVVPHTPGRTSIPELPLSDRDSA